MKFNINLLIGGTPCRGCALFHKRWFALVGSKFSDYNLNKSLNWGEPLVVVVLFSISGSTFRYFSVHSPCRSTLSLGD